MSSLNRHISLLLGVLAPATATAAPPRCKPQPETFTQLVAKSVWGTPVATGLLDPSEGLFVDATHGIVVGDAQRVAVTHDGGAHWVLEDLSVAQRLNAVTTTQGKLVAVGEGGAIVARTDTTWTAIDAGTQVDLFDVMFHERTGIAVGAGGTVLRSADGGQHWTPTPPPSTRTLRTVTTLQNGTWLVAGDDLFVAASEDDGRTWTPAVVQRVTPIEHPTFRSAHPRLGGIHLMGPGVSASVGELHQVQAYHDPNQTGVFAISGANWISAGPDGQIQWHDLQRPLGDEPVRSMSRDAPEGLERLLVVGAKGRVSVGTTASLS